MFRYIYQLFLYQLGVEYSTFQPKEERSSHTPDFGLIIVETLKELLKKAITLLTLIYNAILGVGYILYL